MKALIDRRQQLVILGFIFTILLIVAFVLFQHFLPSIMQLDVKWIVVACIPLVIALIMGGYIRVIKGFGVELETKIEEPITTLELKAQEVFESTEGMAKDTIGTLYDMSLDRKREINRLQFITKQKGNYAPTIVSEYMRELPNLEYFEIIDKDGFFVCLLPINLFSDESGNPNGYEIERFIDNLEKDSISVGYGKNSIDVTIKAGRSIVSVLETLRSSRMAEAAVVDTKGTVLGIIKVSDIE